MTTDVRERPIIFSGPMVRAILAGKKTQTRRIVTPQPTCNPDGAYESHDGWTWYRGDVEEGDHEPVGILGRPYGAPGDRLWVKETFSNSRMDDSMPTHYRADQRLEDLQRDWRPSIFMPRWASRLTLEVEAVRVERLQEITADDVFDEGMGCWDDGARLERESIEDFAAGWDSINGKRAPWSSNPWVWVVTFRVVKP